MDSVLSYPFSVFTGKSTKVSKYVLMTGATGLLGQYLIRDLLLNNCRLALVVRPDRRHSIRERMETILQMWETQLGRLLPRPVCLEGNVTAENMGLSDASMQWVTRNCDTVLHNAAVLTFFGKDRDGEPWRTNLQGTQHMLDVCREAGIEKLHYVSTAYVCGTRNGPILEDDFEKGQDFRNDYEKSKFEAERLVRRASFIEQLTVYRPAVIVGDSKTGYMATYHGLGMYLKLMAVMIGNLESDEDGVRHTPLYLPCRGDEPRNTIPVDWVSAVMTRLFDNPDAHGGTYHITPDEPFTARELIEAAEVYFHATGTVFDADEIGVNDFDRLSHEHLDIYHAYLTTDPEFDTRNLKTLVPNLPNPKIGQEMIHRFIQYGEEDCWGKRRKKFTEPVFWIGDILDHIVADNVADNIVEMPRGEISADSTELGLDIWGAGGGQFCLKMTGDRLIDATEGLPDEDVPVVRMSAMELGRRMGVDMSSLEASYVEQVEGTSLACEDDELAAQLVGAMKAIGGFDDLLSDNLASFAAESTVEQESTPLEVAEAGELRS